MTRRAQAPVLAFTNPSPDRRTAKRDNRSRAEAAADNLLRLWALDPSVGQVVEKLIADLVADQISDLDDREGA